MTTTTTMMITAAVTLVHLLPSSVSAVHVNPRHCHGHIKHIHLAVGHDPTTQMTISFATKWAYPDIESSIAGVHVGTKPYELDRFIPEQEEPLFYESTIHHTGEPYYSPYQHHITIAGLEPDTTYYYVPVIGNRDDGIDNLEAKPIRDHPSQHSENYAAEQEIFNEEEEAREGEEESNRRRRRVVAQGQTEDSFTPFDTSNSNSNYYYYLRHSSNAEPGEDAQDQDQEQGQGRRYLAPPPYDGSDVPCIADHEVRSFRTAPKADTDRPVVFAIIGDLGQFDHSQETLQHMKEHCSEEIDATVLVGDIAYTEFDHRRWDTFFDFLDDQSIFAQVPLMIAAGNHDIDKLEHENEIFQAYENRFRMPQVRPAQLGTYEGPDGWLNMDAPFYPLPYDWGNSFYSFDYGPAKHIILNAYTSMEEHSAQYNWFKKQLETVDRDVTPWVLVTIHVPIYNTFSLHPHDLQIVAARDNLEPLMIEHHVNMVFTGHIHAYLRTDNVAKEQLVETGPIHITIGAGGRQCDAPFKSKDAEEWVVTRDASYYGYGKFTIYNKNSAEWRWVPLSHSDKYEYNRIKGDNEMHLPSLEHDTIMVENQHYIHQRKLQQEQQD